MKKSRTDWNQYYKKRSRFSVWAQGIQRKYILSSLVANINTDVIHSAAELGGADSCFFEYIMEIFGRLSVFRVVDFSEVGLHNFREKYGTDYHGVRMNAIKADLLAENTGTVGERSDFVYSLGLVEHFDAAGTSEVIRKHFEFVNEKGYVLITFPTPTLKYRIVRKFMEVTGTWQFWDERPLRCKEFEAAIGGLGGIIEKRLMKKMPLTQMMYLIQKY